MAWVTARRKVGQAAGDRPAIRALPARGAGHLTAEDRIPLPTFRAAAVDNFWQDKTHVKGSGAPPRRRPTPPPIPMRTLIDFDACRRPREELDLQGVELPAPDQTICLVRLSDGGTDAVELREFDTVAGRFVDGASGCPDGKQYAEWLDKDTLALGRDWDGKGSTLTESGYPFVVKIYKRGQRWRRRARSTAAGRPTSGPSRWCCAARKAVDALLANRGTSFFEAEHYLITDKGPVKLPFRRSTDPDLCGRPTRLHRPGGLERLQVRRPAQLRPRRAEGGPAGPSRTGHAPRPAPGDPTVDSTDGKW